MKVAVCDDEPIHRKRLVSIIQMTLDLKSIKYSIFEFTSGEELILSSEVFDIYFLDIKMDKLTGIEAAKKIRQENQKAGVVFVTALKEYVFDAFDINAFHYLLKPVNEDKLREVLCSFLNYNNKQDYFIIAKTANLSVKIFYQDIIYIESQLRKIIVHTNDGIIEYYFKLSDIEQELQGHSFFRCHKSYIVNLQYVCSYSNNCITLKNSETVFLSKYKYSEFSKAFMYYLKSGEY